MTLRTRIIFRVLTVRAANDDIFRPPSKFLNIWAVISQTNGSTIIRFASRFHVRYRIEILHFGKQRRRKRVIYTYATFPSEI